MKKLGLIMALTLCLVTVAGCGKKEPSPVQNIKNAGTLKVALVNDDTLICQYDEAAGTYTGIEPGTVQTMADNLGVTITYSKMSLADARTALETGNADIAIGSINNEVDYQYNYGISPEYKVGYVYAVTERGNFVDTYGALKGKNVGIYRGISNTVRKEIEGIENVSINEYEDIDKVKADLKSGKIEAYFCYEKQAKNIVTDTNYQTQNIMDAALEYYVILTNVNSPDVLNEVNTALAQYSQIYKEQLAASEAEDENTEESQTEN